jgi:hypothetical protein
MSFSLSTQHLLWIAVSAVAVTGFIFWTYRFVLQRLSRGAGWGLTLLRLAAALLLLIILCEPAGRILFSRSEPPRVVLLVDASGSMGLTDRLGSRQETLQTLLSGETIRALASRYHLEAYQFAERLTPLALSAFDSLKLLNAATDIGAALEFVKTRARLDSLGGVVLITDGNFTVGRDPLRVADGLGVPVYAIGIGDTLEVRDTAIVGHLTNDVAYVDSKIPVEVTLHSQGIAPVRVPVTLSEDDRVIDTEQVELAGDGRDQSVTLHVVPTSDGVHQYTLSIPEQPAELTTQNNRRSFSIKVLKTKLRILYIEGSPRPDIPFLKQTLQSDPNIEVTSVIFRPDRTPYPAALPETRAGWFENDLIILGSVEAERIRRWETHIVEFVAQKGGGLIVLGGPRSFDLGGYAGTPLGDLFPVSISPDTRGMLEGLFVPVLTPDGQVHPLMKLHDDAVVSGQRWAELPPLPGINMTGPAKPGATVLAAHPTWQTGGASAPVIAVHRYGLGKVLAITAHELWRWDLLMWGTGRTNASYERFWSNAVRWVTTQEGSQRVRVVSEKTQYRGGEPVVLNGQVYDENYHPLDGAAISVVIQSKQPDMQPVRIDLPPAGTGSGRYRGAVQYLAGGAYTYTARAVYEGVELGTDTGGFTVGENGVEFEQTPMNRDLLVRLSGMTGGRFYTAGEADRLSGEMDLRETVTEYAQNVQLWHHPVIFVLFVALLSCEWLLRRRYGLL